MRREYLNHCIAWESGLPVAQPFELLVLDGRPGIIFERIIGETLLERFIKQMLNQTTFTMIEESDIRITARALSEIHNKVPVGSLSSQRDNINYAINSVGYLTLGEKSKIISVLDALPVKQLFCHGDPNPGNIMVRNDGNYVLIDWMNASTGNPEADIAEYLIMIRYAILPSYLPGRVSEYFNTIRESIIRIFMDEYFKATGISIRDVDPWIIPVAARKLLADAISEDEKKLLIKEIRRYLHQLTEY